MKPKKKRNPADLTKRNNDARKKEIARLRERITNLEDVFIAMVLEVRTMGKQSMISDGVQTWCSSCKLNGVGK